MEKNDIVVNRTHDKEIYLNEDRYDRPKEYFKLLTKLIDQELKNKGAGSKVLDVGCATGEFLYYFSSQYPKASIFGSDIIPEFIEQCKKRVTSGTFSVGSIEDMNSHPKSNYDLVYALGVVQIFDQWEKIYLNLLSWVKKGGRAYVFGPFNQFPIDVWIKYKLSNDPNQNHREPGWNLISLASIKKFLLDQPQVDKVNFYSFELPFDLPQNENDLVRTWTVKDEEGKRHLTNGLSIVPHYGALEIICKS